MFRSGTHSYHSRVAKPKVNSLKTGGRQGSAMGFPAYFYCCLDPSGDEFTGNWKALSDVHKKLFWITSVVLVPKADDYFIRKNYEAEEMAKRERSTG